MLTDRLLCTWRELLDLQKRGIHSVSQLQIMRRADFRRGKHLGKEDHIVHWLKPSSIRSVDWPTYKALPEYITVRECRVHIQQPGFRSKAIVVVTTLLDAAKFTKEDLAELYRARWNAELDLRSLKQTMQMDILRCKTPELARKEIWMHILAYNLIRTIMAQAADQHGIQPRTISFKGAVQTLEAFQPVIAMKGQHDFGLLVCLYHAILDTVASHRVADRPDRFEPRKVKRRPKRYDRLMKPRQEAKRDILNGFSKN